MRHAGEPETHPAELPAGGWAQMGSFTVTGKGGSNRIELRGRIGGRTLAPGAYRLVARETDLAGNSSDPKRAAFRIVRR